MGDQTSARDTLPDQFRLGMTPTADDFEDLINAATDASELTTGTLDNSRLAATVEADAFSGDGAALTNLNASQLTSGTLDNARLPSTVETDAFAGDGSALTKLNASAIKTGTLANERLASTVVSTAFEGESATFSGKVKASNLEGNGASITGLNAAQLTSGTVANERLNRYLDLTVDDTEGDVSSITAGQFMGDGQNLINLNPTAFSTGKIPVNNLPDGTASARGIVRFATTDDIDNARTDRAVTAEILNQTKQSLNTSIDEQKTRIDAILDSSSADKDSFAEIVALINSVDTESDLAFANYVLTNDQRSSGIEADIQSEAQTRQSEDNNRYTKNESDQRYLQLSGGTMTGTLAVGGTLTVDDATTLNNGLSVTGDATVSGDVIAAGDVTAFSDEQLKTNIQPIENALTRLTQLNGVTFTRTDLQDNKRHAGFIAQEVQAVFPEVVHKQGELLALAYGNLVALLVESIKELNGKVLQLENQLTELQAN